MKKNRKASAAPRRRGVRGLFALALVATQVALADATRVQLWFDTEDYVDPSAWDAMRELATIMTEEGVRGHFNVVGHLARVLVENRRSDVLEAMRRHVIGTQTLYHSWHPNITEKSDLADYDEAYRLTLRDESACDAYLRLAFGLDRVLFSCYPGNGSSHVALDVHSDLGAVFHGGLGAISSRCRRGDAMWYQNLRQILYNGPMSLQDLGLDRDLDDAEIGRRLDRAAEKEAVVFYMHPCIATCTKFWDGVNLRRGNLVEFGHWKPAPQRDPAQTKRFYARFRDFIRRVKSDPRFAFTDCERLLATQKPRVAITRADVPAIRASLMKELGPVDRPASWSVADCFQAAVKFLLGETRHEPGKVYGFLEKPVGVTETVRVKASDLRAAAKALTLRRHLPTQYRVGDVTLGPADFLYAALEVLDTGADEVTVTPRDQLGALDRHIPSMVSFRHTDGWIYWPAFKDRYLADRLRWQFWTLRWESPDDRASPPTVKDELAAIRRKAERELFDEVVPFWMKNSVDRDCGGFLTCLDREGKPYDTFKHLWMQWREVYMFASLYNAGYRDPKYLELAEHGYRFLFDKCREPDGRYHYIVDRRGAVLQETDGGQEAFTESFAALGCAALYEATKDVKYRREAESAYAIYRRKTAKGSGRYDLLAYPMIELNVVQTMHRAFGGYDAEIDGCIRRILRFVEPATGIIYERAPKAGGFELETQFGRFVTPGHALEGLFFILQRLKEKPDAELQALVLKEIRIMGEFGWDPVDGGIWYNRDGKGLPMAKNDYFLKAWWPQVEAMNAMITAYRVSGDRYYLDFYRKIRAYAETHLRDPKHGEWYAYAANDRRQFHDYKGSRFKGFFHLPRYLLNTITVLRELQRQ